MSLCRGRAHSHTLFIHLFGVLGFVAACGLSLVALSGGFTLAAVLKSLTAGASLVVECEL